MRPDRFAFVCSLALAAWLATAQAQVAPIPYLVSASSLGLNGEDVAAALDEDGNRKGFSFQSFSVPATSFVGSSGLPGLGAFGSAGLVSSGAQYGYSFKGLGHLPMTLFGGVSSLRTTPDVFTSLVTPGFERSSTLATSVNAGIEFKPASNISLSLSGSFTQPSATTDTDLRSQLISAQQPAFLGWR